MKAIELKNVCKEYKDFKISNISLELPTGCIMGLVGENGAGKTTLVRLLISAIRATSGEITVLGKDISSADFVKAKEEIGVVLDFGGYNNAMTPVQIEKYMRLIYKSWDSALYNEYLERFSLPKNKKMKNFSQGMTMKLSIAAALSHHPRLLILDEPTNGLDPVARDDIVSIFSEFTRDERNSVLITSHIVSDLEKICDYIAIISNGKIELCGEKDALEEKYAIVNCREELFESLDKSAVFGSRSEKYGVRAMVEREKIPQGMEAEKAGIEDMMIFLAKREDRT